jgi:hypothetical protein
MEAMEKVDFPTAEPDQIVATLLHRGCVLLSNFVDTLALERAYDVMVKAYDQVEIFHIQPGQLRQLGLPMYSDILFSQPHYDLLAKVFGGRDYEISAETASRRVGRVREPPHWLAPLGPHLDAFIHAPRFTVNFWIPFQECGVDAPGLGVVEVSFTGYDNGAEVWADPAPVGEFTRFRPAMQAMCRHRDPAVIAELHERFHDRIRTPSFAPGDAMMLSNWTLHLTHATPAMTKTRENLELRFWSSASLEDILREHGI